MDLHQGQIQGFFNIPVDELTAVHMLSAATSSTCTSRTSSSSRTSGSRSAPARSRSSLDAPLAIVEKRRHGNLDRAEVMNVIGEVRGQRRDHRGRRDRHRRHADRDHPRARARGRDRDLRLRHPRRAVRPRHRADRELRAARGRHHGHDPALPVKRQIDEDQGPLGRAAHRRGDQADPPRRVRGRAVLAPRSRSPRRCSCGRTGSAAASTTPPARPTTPPADDDVPSPMPASAGA